MNRTFISLAAAALSTAAIFASPAAYAADARLNFGDLDLSTPAGQRELAHRIDAVTRAVCADQVITGTHINPAPRCRAQLTEQLNAQVRERVARGGLGG